METINIGALSANTWSFQKLALNTGLNQSSIASYGIKYTTASQYNIDLPDQTARAGQLLATQIPAAGVITIYGK